MARPSRPWFRFYVEALRDPKLRRLTPSYRWCWVAVLGMARSSPAPGRLLIGDGLPATIEDLADAAGMRRGEVQGALVAFEKHGMIEWDGEAMVVPRWADRQYESDSSTERVAKQRSKERGSNGQTSLPGTPPETETEPEVNAREPFEEQFIRAWAAYPRKLGRKAALRAFQATARRGEDPEHLVAAARHYGEVCGSEKREARYVKHGSTFYGPGEPWRDFVERAPVEARGIGAKALERSGARVIDFDQRSRGGT